MGFVFLKAAIRMKCIFTLLLVILSRMSLSAQTVEDSVKIVVNRMFAAMKNGDAAGLSAVMADSALLQTISVNKEGKTVVRNQPISVFITSITSLAAGDADERIHFDMVKIDGPLASVWTPYSFYYKGQFSHCGVNSFQLVRINKEWKIQYIIDSRRKEGCQ
jgi:hypothetical protein